MRRFGWGYGIKGLGEMAAGPTGREQMTLDGVILGHGGRPIYERETRVLDHLALPIIAQAFYQDIFANWANGRWVGFAFDILFDGRWWKR